MRLLALLVGLLGLGGEVAAVAVKPPVGMAIKASCAGKLYEVQVEAADTFGEVCSALCESNKLKSDDQAVFHRGKLMNKRRSIIRSGIREGDTINIHPNGKKFPKKNTLKTSNTIQKDIENLKSGNNIEKESGDNNKKNNKQSMRDINKLQEMLKKGIGNNEDFLTSLQSDPSRMIDEVMGSNFFEDLLGNEMALESMRNMIRKNMGQYEKMFPGFSVQAKLLTSSPLAFKSAIKMAKMQLNMMKGSASTTEGGSYASALLKKKNDSATDSLSRQIRFNETAFSHQKNPKDDMK